MFTSLMLGSGVFWTLTYLLIIHRDFQDRTHGMPLVALCANLPWEFIFAFLYPHEPVQRSVNIVWFTFDLVILMQLLWYGPHEFADLPKPVFDLVFGLALLTSFSLVLVICAEFNDWTGAYAAFGQNLLMSVLFITMLYRRRSLRGQSIWIALCKLIGTALASLAFYLYSDRFRGSVLLNFLYVSILVYDLIYVGLVWRQQHVQIGARHGLAAPSEHVETGAIVG